MGLDMWLKRVRKLEEKEASEINGKRVSEANEKGYSTVRADEDGEETVRYILDYVQKIPLVTTLIDGPRMMRENGIPEDAELCFRADGPDGISFGFSHETFERSKEVSLSYEELKKYLYDKEEDYFVYAAEEEAYWRKNYELSAFVSAACKEEHGEELGNCQYLPIEGELLKEICGMGGVSVPASCEEGECIAYYEWY